MPLNSSPEHCEYFCLTEKVEVAEFKSERLLEIGKFGFWIYKTLVIEFNGGLELSHLAQTAYCYILYGI